MGPPPRGGEVAADEGYGAPDAAGDAWAIGWRGGFGVFDGGGDGKRGLAGVGAVIDRGHMDVTSVVVEGGGGVILGRYTVLAGAFEAGAVRR